ncbi:MAG: MarR family winged helix-turn-helix transcriptional regulator [Lachnospiraceae bacterium]
MDANNTSNNNIYDCLKLDNQLCFPLYACAKEIVRRYKPYLDELDLTYTQYICMMVIWEKGSLSVKELGERLYLDSGTLTPVLKKLEHKGYLTRKRSQLDERSLIVTVTDKGIDLREEALAVPEKMGGCVNISPEDSQQLYKILYKLLGSLTPQEY